MPAADFFASSFTEGGTLPNTPEFVNLGDPWMASDRAGNIYYSTLAFDFGAVAQYTVASANTNSPSGQPMNSTA